ncbi:DUF2206 domain-containing protein [Methanosarcina sp. WWM596]|uniref:DUF2206 domain-containing protein n=1 Tax=Methanosarcina sp. WWM596 TaxID=1434103 RepID=UPI000615DF52|nr:DUF2206 domain-containing protein [Methanosarcina sp. WWM596]AKB17644.1 Conserved transmembrane protein [Methanosarcina sp. WWM596]
MEKIINYDAKKFLIFLFSIHCALVGSILLDFLNFPVPILRQVIGFVYLTFVPGIVLHRALKLRKLTFLESFICIVGLSMLFIMFSGFFINSLGYFFTDALISTIPLTLIIGTILLFLSLICYMRDKNESNEVYSSTTKTSLSLPLLFLCTIPFLSIIGSYLINFYHTNILAIISIIFIIIVLIIVTFTDLLPKNLYPFSIFIISISILYHNSLASTFLDGWDIHFEYYFANLVLGNSLWDSTIPLNVNAMLSIVMLAPIYSEICNLELTYVFKIVYPFIFSMVPIGIYHIYQKQILNEKIAFISVFYFMSIYTFFTEMLALARQQIAEFFFVLIFLIMLSNLDLFKKRLLMVLFVLGLVTSHYGLSYLILLFMPVGYLFMTYVLKHKSDTYTINFMLLFSIIVFIWYTNFTQGSVLETIVSIFGHIHESIMDDLFSTRSVELATSTSPFLSGQILRMLYLLSQFFIAIGFITVYLKPEDFKISNEYFGFSFVFLSVLITSFFTSSTGMNIHRLYHITSIFLSMFCVVGGFTFFQSISKILHTHPISYKKSLKILSVFFAVFMIFNVGIGQQIIHDNPTSVSINREWAKNSDNLEHKYVFYKMHFPSQDVTGTKWLSKNRNSTTKIYADLSSTALLFFSYGMIPGEPILTDHSRIEPGSYVYLRYPNVNYGIMYGPKQGMKWNITDIPLSDQNNLIYSNYDNSIYKL